MLTLLTLRFSMNPTLYISTRKCLGRPMAPNVIPPNGNKCDIDCFKDENEKGFWEIVCASNGVNYPSRCFFNKAKW